MIEQAITNNYTASHFASINAYLDKIVNNRKNVRQARTPKISLGSYLLTRANLPIGRNHQKFKELVNRAYYNDLLSSQIADLIIKYLELSERDNRLSLIEMIEDFKRDFV